MFRALSENLGVLLRVFGFYAKMTLLRTLTSGPLSHRSNSTGASSQVLTIGKMEWLGFVKECKLYSKKLGNERTLRQLTLAPGPAALATFPEFLAAIVKLSFWRANPTLEEGNSEQIEASRREFRVRALPDCFVAALQNHVLPLAQRDSSQRFRARLAQDDGVQTLMRDYKEQLQETFVQLTADNRTLDCPTALAWLEQCGVLGHAAIRAPVGPDALPGSAVKTIPSVLSIDGATDAFVEALPAVACLSADVLETEGELSRQQLTSLRHFQEWLARCGEIKYGGLGHLSLYDRTAGFLQNVFERRSTESFILEAMTPPPADRFDAANWPSPPEMSRSELALLLATWDHMDLSSLPGFPTWEQPIFELLAQCMAPLVGIFGYYARSSLHHSLAELSGYVELQGWNDFIVDCNAVTKSFSGQRAAELFMDAPKCREGLSFPEFVQCVVLTSAQRANAALLDLHKRTAPRLTPVEQSLHLFLNSNVLPLAKSRNLIDAHRTFQEDEELQRVLGIHGEKLAQLFLAAKASDAADGDSGSVLDDEQGVDIDQFVQVFADLGLFGRAELQLSVWESTITPVQPGEVGLFVRKPFNTKFLDVDAKQAFLDTLLSDALVVSSLLPHDVGAAVGKLPPSGLLEAVVRCAMAKYNAIDVLTTAGKTASLIDGLLRQVDDQTAASTYVQKHAPQRFDAQNVEIPQTTDWHRAQEQRAWLQIWSKVDLSDLPGFPEWDRAAFEQLQANWQTLLSIFVFYSRGYGGNAAGAHGALTPWGFLQWADDSKILTKVFSDARVQDIFDYTVSADGKGGETMSFPGFIQSVVRCAFERANPKWHRDENGRLTTGLIATYLIAVPDCLYRFLHNCVFRFSPRDPCLGFSQQLARDEATKQIIEAREAEVMQLLSYISGVDAKLDNPIRLPLDVDVLTKIYKERGILGRTNVSLKGGRLATCDLSEAQVVQATSDAATFVKGRAGGGFSANDSDGPQHGLSPEEFVELLCRSAQLKYANIPGMSMAQRVSAFLGILIDGDNPEAAINATVSKSGASSFSPEDEEPPSWWDEDKQAAWLALWNQLDLSGLPGYAQGAKALFLLLREHADGMQDIFCQYSKNHNPDGTLNLDSWDAFVRDGSLVTRAMGHQRTTAIFEHSAITNKLGQPVLRYPQFLMALINISYLRSNPVSAMTAGRTKPTPLARAVSLLVKHLYSRFMEAPPQPSRLPPPSDEAGSHVASGGQRKVKRQTAPEAGEEKPAYQPRGSRVPASSPISGPAAGPASRATAAPADSPARRSVQAAPAAAPSPAEAQMPRPSMRRPAAAGGVRLNQSSAGPAREKPRFDGLLPVLRKNIYARMFGIWREYTLGSIEESQLTVVKFRDKKRGGKLNHLFAAWREWLNEWNSAIHEAGFVLRPHLPLNQHSAFSHWRYWSHAPQLMTSVCRWYMVRVTEVDRANASNYTLHTVERAVNLKNAFARWEKLHSQTVRAVSMTNHLQRRLCATLLLRVVDAWVRLTIQEHGARLYKERRMTGGTVPVRTAPSVLSTSLGASQVHGGHAGTAAEQEAFMSRSLEPRPTAARPGAHAWALLEAKLQMHHLPGISEHLPRIHALLQENLPSLCSVFRSYAKMHIQPSEGLLSLSCLQLHEWLLFCEEVGLSSVTEPQQQLLMASQFENAQRRHLHGGLMSLPEFLEAFVCTSVLARREDSRGHPIDVVTRVQRSLEALQPLVARDMAPGFRMTFWADTQAMRLLQENDHELRQVFVKNGWLRGGGVSLADFERFVSEHGLVCEAYWVQPLGSVGCELSMTLEQVMEAFVDSLDMFAGESSSWLPTGLPYEGWLECLGRCAVGLYGPLELLKLHQLLDCILRNVLQGETIEQSANGVWLETRDSLASWVASANAPAGKASAGAGNSAVSGAVGSSANATPAAESGKDVGAKGAKDNAKDGAGKDAKTKKKKAEKPHAAAKDTKGTPAASGQPAEDDADAVEEASGPLKSPKVANVDASKVVQQAVPSVAANAQKSSAGMSQGMAVDTRSASAGSEELRMQPRAKKQGENASSARQHPPLPISKEGLRTQASPRGLSPKAASAVPHDGKPASGRGGSSAVQKSMRARSSSPKAGRPTTDRSGSPAPSPRGSSSQTTQMPPRDPVHKPSSMAPPPPRSPKILLAPPTADVLGGGKAAQVSSRGSGSVASGPASQDPEKWFAAPKSSS